MKEKVRMSQETTLKIIVYLCQELQLMFASNIRRNRVKCEDQWRMARLFKLIGRLQ